MPGAEPFRRQPFLLTDPNHLVKRSLTPIRERAFRLLRFDDDENLA
jgi:hypothetical protein